MCHVKLREAHVKDTDHLTETMQGEASAFSETLMDSQKVDWRNTKDFEEKIL